MIHVTRNDPNTSYRPGRYRCVIDLTDTVAAAHAPLGIGAGQPHVVGYAETTRGAIDDAWRVLGEHIGLMLEESKKASES